MSRNSPFSIYPVSENCGRVVACLIWFFFAAFIRWSLYLSMVPTVFVPWNPALLVDEPKRSKISGMRSTRKEGISFTSVNRQLILSGFKWLTQPLPAENLAKCLTFRMEWRTNIWERRQAHSCIIRKHQTFLFNPCYKLVQLLNCLGFRTGMTILTG